MRRVLLLLLLLCTQPVHALSVAQISGEGWQIRDLRLQLSLDGDNAQGSIEVATLQLPEPLGELRELRLSCQPLIFTAQRIACLDAPLTTDWALLDKPAAVASFEYIAASGALRLDIKGLHGLGGKLAVNLHLQAQGWQAGLQGKGLLASRVAPLLAAAGQNIGADAGQLEVAFKLRGNDEGLEKASLDLQTRGLTANDEAGERASEALDIKLSGFAEPQAAGWRGHFELAATRGQLYVNPVFFDLAGGALNLASSVRYQPSDQRLLFEQARLRHAGTLELAADGELRLGEAVTLATLNLDIQSMPMDTAYPVYLQPFLLGSGLDEMETAGRIVGRVEMGNGRPSLVRLQLQGVTAHDLKQRYSIDDLQGEIHWHQGLDRMRASRLRWAGGSAYRLPFEAGELQVRAAADQLALLEPLRLGLLGGALRVNQLQVQGLGTQALALDFDGAIEPLSLTELTRALGWPEFAGTLSGRLPDLSYRNGDLTVGGTLAAEVFDGKLAVDGLRIADPFGRLPRLRADMHFRNLDLAAATSAFQFGAIEGRLHGDVTGLRMLNWQPVAFDARFYTPPDDRSRHRISQRAIENISALGGAGAGAALSRGFMRFFENFAYARLGISCKLTNGVCLMGGIEAAPDKGGYYLVKGKLLPRIDVIGYANEVSWTALMEQLRSITAGEGPEVR